MKWLLLFWADGNQHLYNLNSRCTQRPSSAPTSSNYILLIPRYVIIIKSTMMIILKRALCKVCTVNLIVRKLETSVMAITPHLLHMESETVLTQYIITNWLGFSKLLIWLSSISFQDAHIHQRHQLGRRSQDDLGPQEKNPERHPDRLPTHHPRPHHSLRDQLLQGLLLRGDGDGEPDLPPGAHHLVHQRRRQLAPDRLRQDGRHLAHICASNPLSQLIITHIVCVFFERVG